MDTELRAFTRSVVLAFGAIGVALVFGDIGMTGVG
jgi:hypothetical protein